jgi:acetyl-CoA synthase
MPKALKEGIAERFNKEAERVGEPDLLDKVATEEDATTEEEVAEYLAKVNHPALSLDPLF